MSNSDVVIRVEGLGKKYAIHQQTNERYFALSDVLTRKAKSAGRLLNPFTLAGQLCKPQRQAPTERAVSDEDFWALKDVSFEIRRGERVGIIGRNGAGKSTLLKILSRITEPTTGRVEIRGRLASLLEVGTGFHPELTGRENIYLNGAILGMSQREVRSKFGEIVEFAEVEKFLDTPVKRYSSGMYVRLAFAVAAHLEPEILVVDEVLAVGDASFQKKCLGKMEDVAKEGRTIFFVSHDINAVLRLCSLALLLEGGTIRAMGSPMQIADQYYKHDLNPVEYRSWSSDLQGLPSSKARLASARIINSNYQLSRCNDITCAVGIEVTYVSAAQDVKIVPGINVFNVKGDHIFSSHDIDASITDIGLQAGRHVSIAWIPGNFFSDGSILVDIALMTYEPFEVIQYESSALSFTVIDNFSGASARGSYCGHFPGIIRPLLKWSNRVIDSS